MCSVDSPGLAPTVAVPEFYQKGSQKEIVMINESDKL